MWIIIGRRLKRDKRGVSNIIVVVLSLVIIVVIVANIVLRGYQMNQLDWEKMKEDLKINDVARVTRSSWFVTQSEYGVNVGSRTSGTYVDTQAVDASYESFIESHPTPPRRLDINGTFVIDVSVYPLAYIQTVEIQLRYRASDLKEKWYLKAYNWATNKYSDSGFNSTTGHTPTTGWDYYAVNLTNQWSSYVRNDGSIFVKLEDAISDPPSDRTTIDVDFLGVRVAIDGARFTFKNEGSLTTYIVSLWIINSTNHRRYNADVVVNSGETYAYTRADTRLPTGSYTVKVATERGNTAVYSVGS